MTTIRDWLEDLGLGRFADVFEENEVDLEALRYLTESMLEQLGVPEDARDFAALGSKGRLAPGTELPAPSGIFPRHVETEETEGA